MKNIINEQVLVESYVRAQTTETRAKYFEEIVQDMLILFRHKNHDYGNSYALQRLKRPDSIIVRLYDKLMRVESLMKSPAKVTDESLEDTLRDLATYCIMELVERRIEGEARKLTPPLIEAAMSAGLYTEDK